MNETFSNISIAEEEISVIKKIMEDSKKAIVDNGWHYIYWGSIVTAALVTNYIMVLQNVSVNSQGMLWFISMTGAAIIEGVIERKREKHAKVKTFAGKLLNTLWSGSGICMFILGFAGILSGAYNAIMIFPLISIVLGMAYLISGIIQNVKWLSALCIFWWAGSIIMLLFPGLHSMLVFAAMIVCFQIIPGLVMFAKSKKELKLLSA
jgi:hypothetical protein